MKRIIYSKISSAVLIILLICIQMKTPMPVAVSGKAEQTKLAILMYHGFKNEGEETTYVIRAENLEKDIVYLKENGFNFVGVQDLIDHYEQGKTLPSKPVMLTFDDGYLNNYVYAFPILKKYNAKAVISPIAYFSEFHTNNPDANTAYSHMTWSQIKEMHDSGLVEFENHSYNMHSMDKGRDGSAKSNGENSKEYKYIFFKDMITAHMMIKNATGNAPRAYVYPFGSISNETVSLLKCCGYKVSMSCTEGYNYLTDDDDCLFKLKRFNRTPDKSASYLLSNY